MIETLFGISLVILAILAYFLPFIVSCANDHKNWVQIGIINLLIGWMFIPWVLALVWASISNHEEKQNG